MTDSGFGSSSICSWCSYGLKFIVHTRVLSPFPAFFLFFFFFYETMLAFRHHPPEKLYVGTRARRNSARSRTGCSLADTWYGRVLRARKSEVNWSFINSYFSKVISAECRGDRGDNSDSKQSIFSFARLHIPVGSIVYLEMRDAESYFALATFETRLALRVPSDTEEWGPSSVIFRVSSQQPNKR